MTGILARLRLISALVLTVTFAWSAGAGTMEHALMLLRAEELRPSIKDIVENSGGVNAPNPFVEQTHPDPRLAQVMTMAPSLIAAMEAAYPGATWAPLGRDSAYLADILEAYYLSIGQPERVVRLNASTGSFAKGMEKEFLETNGLKIGAKGLPPRPYVVIDATSWRGTTDVAHSQSRKLMQAIYGTTAHTLWSRLYDRLNVIGQGAATGGSITGSEITPTLDLAQFKNEVSFGSAGPSKILYISKAFSYGEAAWHDKFEVFQRHANADGTVSVIAPPGGASSTGVREAILWNAFEVAKVVQSPEFLKRVDAEMAKYGFTRDAIVKHPELYDDEAFEKLRASRAWDATEIRAWAKGLGEIPKTARRAALDLVLGLIETGVQSGHFKTSEFQALLHELDLWRGSEIEFLRILLERKAVFADELTKRLVEYYVDPANHRAPEEWRKEVVEFVKREQGLFDASLFQVLQLRPSDFFDDKNLSPLDQVRILEHMPDGLVDLDFYRNAFQYNGKKSTTAESRNVDHWLEILCSKFASMNADTKFYLEMATKVAYSDSTRGTLYHWAASVAMTFDDLKAVSKAEGVLTKGVIQNFDRLALSSDGKEREKAIDWLAKTYSSGIQDVSLAQTYADMRIIRNSVLPSAQISRLADVPALPVPYKRVIRGYAIEAANHEGKDALLATLRYDQAHATTEESMMMNELAFRTLITLPSLGATTKDALWIRNKIVFGKTAKTNFDRVYDPSQFAEATGIFARAARAVKSGAARCSLAVSRKN